MNLKYPANHFIEKNKEALKGLIEAFPLATLISTYQDQIHTSYLPFIWDANGFLIGHLDANNPQVALLKDGKKVSLIFNGPEAYISPAHFITNELPTYNYCKVEINGIIRPIADEDLKQAIIKLTSHLEGKQAAYQLTENEKRLHSLINYIYGFKIEIEQLQGRFKMSQDKSKLHQKKAVNLMCEIDKHHTEVFLDVYKKQIQ
ncbi:transcriptional regulator [Psychroflexus planctonicus]|uniref:Transcriptional regulator n=1 Tax=Psychroflexus planctonicus TaxID=1526575 RepID=A0ABQ1SFU7_9FLAO|nr:transcriptional regulator [Psychroflexus planctonicus]